MLDHRALLAEARERTLALIAPVSDADLHRVHTPLLSPLVWDLGHIAAYEDLWVGRRLGGLELLRGDLAGVYDASETPRARRGELPMLRGEEVLAYMVAVRERTREVLDRAVAGLGGPSEAAFVAELVCQHEHQHNETMLQALAYARPGVYRPARREGPVARAEGPATVEVEAGPFCMGAGDSGFSYDNERPAWEATTDGFAIDRTPVSNAAYAEFVADGGYERPQLWLQRGWRWRCAAGVERPLYWTADGGERRFERTEPLDPELPVMHVSWYEADAFARWREARLPSEAEWEKAASWDATVQGGRALPWEGPPASGAADPEPAARWAWEAERDELDARANLDQLRMGPSACGSFPAGTSPAGALQMLGDCWEWTASPLTGYPGFRAHPYPEYSEVFFGGDHRVLRGGSWATRARVARTTFRNWDLPQRRQIFAGFRCVVDLEAG